MIQVCFAPAISWAMAISGVGDEHPARRALGDFPIILGCYGDELTCRLGADAANQAFSLSGKSYKATCEFQPADRSK